MRQTDQLGTAGRLTTVEQVEAIVGRPASMVMLKQISTLDQGCRSILARCPIAAFGYRDTSGTSRTTFIGGTPGFTRVHSPTRISFALPEPGDPYGPVSFFFLLPGVGEILRVNGTVVARKGAQTTVDIEQAYVHCAQAVLRSRLWQPPAPPTPPAPPAPPTLAVPPGPATGTAGGGPLCRPGVGEFLATAPFLALSSWDSAGGSDTSPRGDQPTVVRILDGDTLAIADRRGNKRADTLHNLLSDDRLSFAALVPGRSGVLHVRGRGAITDDPVLLETMALRGIAPHAALLIDVEHAEVTHSPAVARSRLWAPDRHVRPGEVPDLMALAGDHLAAGSANTPGGPPTFLLKAIGAVPGMPRLLRLVFDRAYRSGLRREGYDGVEPDVGERRHGFLARLRRRPAAGPRPDSQLREVRVVRVRQETPDVVTLVLADADDSAAAFDFRPGQYFTLVVDIEGRPARRAYSASSAPGSPQLEVTVKHVEGGRFSTHVHRDLRAGDRLAVRGPSGSFHTGPQASGDIVLVAAGSGVTPMMSMIRARLAARTERARTERGRTEGARTALLYSSRTEQDVIFADELRRLEREHPDLLSVTHVLTCRDRRLDAASVRRWITELSPDGDAHYYLCGPEPLIDTVRGVLTGLGVPDTRVHHELYTSAADLHTRAADPATAPAVPQRMSVEQDGHPLATVLVEPGQTLLDAGLAAGLPMPYSCTVGNCGECVVKLRAGQVAQHEPNCLTPRQQADGYVLACVGRPMSAVTLDITDP